MCVSIFNLIKLQAFKLILTDIFNNKGYFEKRHVDIGYLLFSKEALIGADLALSDKILGLRSTLEVINSGTLYDFKNVL